MSNFTDIFPGGGGAILAPSLATNFYTSRTWAAPRDGIVVVRAMGAGGGGARTAAGSATGGYSGSWGAKAVRVNKNDTVVVSIGAAGVGRATTDGDGAAGGNTTIVIAGVTYIAYGGPGGKLNSATQPPNGPSPSSNWDFGADSVRPGWAVGASRTGGAGVDILAQGGNATTSDVGVGTGGGGTGGASVGTIGGGAFGTASVNGQPAANPGVFVDAGGGEWGISFYGGSGATSTAAGNGGGSSGGNFCASGLGGGGGAVAATGNTGGLGGGGGAGGTVAGGNGGGGFAHLKFYADMGI